MKRSSRLGGEIAARYVPMAGVGITLFGLDFAVSQVPGWHTTIFPPYFVAGAIFSGFAMVLTLLVAAIGSLT